MNNSNFNVVLQHVGGESPITLGYEKCLIRTVLENQRVDCCAIFNGPNGTAIRSYRSGVLVNGEPTSVRQLSTGDVIELPCETKIEVQQATQIRPAISQNGRSTEDIDQQLAKIQSEPSSPENNYVTPPTDGEEKFLSPFSPDLPEITSESFGQPVASTASPENQLTTADALANDVPRVDDSPSVDDQDLESIFAKIGVTNVGSITNPVAENSAPEEAAVTANTAAVPVQPQPVEQLAPSALDEAAAIRRQLEAAMAPVGQAPRSVPNPIAALPEATIESAPAPVVAPQPVAVPQPTAPVVPAAPEAVVAPMPTQVPQAEQSQEDPLAELPADLRDQLNDLVSSLKTGAEETASLSNEIPVVAAPKQQQSVPVQPAPVVPSTPEPTISQPGATIAATAAAATAAAAVAATISTQAAPVSPVVQPVAMPTPVAPTPTPVAATPAPEVEKKPQRCGCPWGDGHGHSGR